MVPPKRKLGELLIAAGVLTEEHLRIALTEQKRWGGFLGRSLIDLGYVSEEIIVKALSHQLKIPSVKLTQVRATAEAVAVLPVQYCEKYGVFPIAFDSANRVLQVATSDPTNEQTRAQLRQQFALRDVQPLIAGASDIDAAIRRYYYGEREGQGAAQTPEMASIPTLGLYASAPPMNVSRRTQLPPSQQQPQPATTPSQPLPAAPPPPQPQQMSPQQQMMVMAPAVTVMQQQPDYGSQAPYPRGAPPQWPPQQPQYPQMNPQPYPQQGYAPQPPYPQQPGYPPPMNPQQMNPQQMNPQYPQQVPTQPSFPMPAQHTTQDMPTLPPMLRSRPPTAQFPAVPPSYPGSPRPPTQQQQLPEPGAPAADLAQVNEQLAKVLLRLEKIEKMVSAQVRSQRVMLEMMTERGLIDRDEYLRRMQSK